MNFDNSLTIVAVADSKISQTVISLRRSKKGINFKEILLLTSKDINKIDNFKELKIIRISPLNSSKDYNHFIIYDLYKYINTSHILLVQWDGFVLNPMKWKDSFLSYDYIGAPFIPRANNFHYSRDEKNNFYSVGNGGFTIRSKSLLKQPLN